MKKETKSKGRGWFGNKEAHRKAGRLGGLAWSKDKLKEKGNSDGRDESGDGQDQRA